ncbi:hypothetical protein QTP88_019273 [Uroleucon formosanum]
MSSNGTKDNKRVKGRAEKARLKRALQLKELANDPRQKKLRGYNEDRCLICTHKLLNSLNMHSSTCSNLYSVYEYILTLSCTQDHLEIFMLMSIERDILETVDFSDILEYLCKRYFRFNEKSAHLNNDV